jgi:exosome complex component MTR3
LRLRLLPKASVDIYVTILEADAGSMLLAQAGAEGAAAGASDIDDALLPAAATAASVALTDAGIEMWGLVVGASLVSLGGALTAAPI